MVIKCCGGLDLQLLMRYCCAHVCVCVLSARCKEAIETALEIRIIWRPIGKREDGGGEEEKLKELGEGWLMDVLSVALQNNLPRKQAIDEALQMNCERSPAAVRAQASGIC